MYTNKEYDKMLLGDSLPVCFFVVIAKVFMSKSLCTATRGDIYDFYKGAFHKKAHKCSYNLKKTKNIFWNSILIYFIAKSLIINSRTKWILRIQILYYYFCPKPIGPPRIMFKNWNTVW